MFYVILGPIPSVLGASKCMHKSIHIQFAPISKAASTTSSRILISLSNILLSCIARIFCAACLHSLQCALYNFPLADRLCRTNYNGQTIPPIPINEYIADRLSRTNYNGQTIPPIPINEYTLTLIFTLGFGGVTSCVAT